MVSNKSTEHWRESYTRDLYEPRGWMALFQLQWLQPGDVFDLRISERDSSVCGTVQRLADTLVFRSAGNTRTTIGMVENVKVFELALDRAEKPDFVMAGLRTWVGIARGKRIGVRGWDVSKAAAMRKVPLRWAPIQSQWIFDAPWVRYKQPRMVPITNVLGDTVLTPMAGYASVDIGKQSYRLEGVEVLSEGVMTFAFRDLSSNDIAYQPGRFLDAPLPVGRRIRLDFNRAYNPPCAYSDFATCPLPHRQNVLDLRIAAGELRYPRPHKIKNVP